MPDPTSYPAIGWLCLAAFSVAGGINQLLRLLDRLKEKPIPAETYLTKLEGKRMEETFHARLADMQSRQEHSETQRTENHRALRAQLEEIREMVRDDVTRIHERIDNAAADTNSRIDGLPERVIATLRNTGAIGR